MIVPGRLNPRKLADLTPENLKELINDIGGPGVYPASDLYIWYVGMCKEDDLEPVTKHMFGVTLRKLGYQSVVRRVCGEPARCWVISKRAVRDPAPNPQAGAGG